MSSRNHTAGSIVVTPLVVLSCCLFLAAVPSPVRAQPDDGVVFKIHGLVGSSYSFRPDPEWANPVFGLDWFGVILGAEFGGDWSLEAGASFSGFLPLDYEADLFLRGGWLSTLADQRDSAGKGRVVRLAVLGGYRFFTQGFEGDGDLYAEIVHCGQAMVGIGITEWFTGRIGFDTQLRFGVSIPLNRQDDSWAVHNNEDAKPTAYLVDVSLTFGVAF